MIDPKLIDALMACIDWDFETVDSKRFEALLSVCVLESWIDGYNARYAPTDMFPDKERELAEARERSGL